MAKLLSIITIVLNDKEGIENTIKSVCSQSCKNFEFIVVDGGSKDGTVDMIKKHKKVIDICISESDNGIYDAMNKGKKLAKGKWIIYLNAGDTFHSPNVLEQFTNEFQNSKNGVIYGDANIIYDKYHSKIKKANTLSFKKGMPFCTQSAFINSNFLKNNHFDNSYKVFGDLDFFIRLEKNNVSMSYVNAIISDFRYDGISSKFNFSHEFEKLSILKKHYQGVANLYIFSILDRFGRFLLKKILPLSLVRKFQLKK